MSRNVSIGPGEKEFMAPGQIEVYGHFNAHLGPKFHSAGLRVQFHYNQAPGIHFKVEPPAEYVASILRGLEDGMAVRFPAFPATGSIWINEINEDTVASSCVAFYQAGRMVIEQAYFFRVMMAAKYDQAGFMIREQHQPIGLGVFVNESASGPCGQQSHEISEGFSPG